ncbi:hypothetical protein CS557_06830 [Acinetobacter junii]|uniref:hypothetical protein n=2 Tax=Acinetobacter junii TaxID=40215 RepID=UPI000C1B5649|nr:hypothetical protein [Acinetobacter junii]ATU45205.1 hypothetical protein CS557_06830 [Acinetobacter junii]
MEVRGYKLLELHTILLCATSYINENFIFSNQSQIDDINYGLIVHAFLLSVFKDQGFSNFKLMQGKNLNAKEHFWLENEDTIIDLTAQKSLKVTKPLILIPKKTYYQNHLLSINEKRLMLKSIPKEINQAIIPIKKVFYKDYY